MKNLVAIMIFVLVLTSRLAIAGVTMDMVTRDGAGQTIDTAKIYAQAGNVRIDNTGRKKSENVSMIFVGDQVLMLNHKDKSYTVMDKAMLEKMTSQMSAAMQEMEKQLAQVPPEQRAMVEQMMKGQMQGMMPKQSAPPAPPRVEKGGPAEWQSYSCTKYTIYEGGQKSQEICAASLDQIEGSDEIMGAFRSMAEFVKKMSESLPFPMASGMAQNPTGMMDQIDGFPVHTIQFEKGSVSQEISFESIAEQVLEDSLFTAPSGYKKQDLFKGR